MQALFLVILLLTRAVDLIMEMLTSRKHATGGPVYCMLFSGAESALGFEPQVLSIDVQDCCYM